MDAPCPCLSPCTEIGIKNAPAYHPAHRESPLQVYRNDPKGRRIGTHCGAYPALFPNMPTRSANGLALTQRSPLARLSLPVAERPVCPSHSAMSALDPKRTSQRPACTHSLGEE